MRSASFAERLQQYPPQPTGSGGQQIPIEIVSMNLVGTSTILGPVTVRESPRLPIPHRHRTDVLDTDSSALTHIECQLLRLAIEQPDVGADAVDERRTEVDAACA
jgi:hypothetical protein